MISEIDYCVMLGYKMGLDYGCVRRAAYDRILGRSLKLDRPRAETVIFTREAGNYSVSIRIFLIRNF